MASTAPVAQTSPPDGSPTIHTQGLTKRYPDGTLAVDGLDLTITEGEFFGLLGPNGAGKTTTIGMLTTLIIPTDGEASVAGRNVRTQPVQVKRAIGVVSQTNTLDRSLTVFENLYYHARYFGLDRRHARAATERVLHSIGLESHARKFPDQLSGGLARRLLIGRALLHGPQVLFLDEPSAGIDPQARLALWGFLEELHAGGQTILLTTHYMEEADRLCRRVAIMDHGRVLAVGSPAELKASVGADTVIHLDLAQVSDGLAAALGALPGVRAVEPGPSGLQIYANHVEGVVAEILQTALRYGVILRDLAVTPPTLETVFLKLTGRELRE